MPLRGSRVREVREKKGLTQKKLAELCHITLYQISRYENDKSDISATSLELLAKHLEVSTDYLLGLSNDQHGRIDNNELDNNEHMMLETYRREGWTGVIRLGADRLSNFSSKE